MVKKSKNNPGFLALKMGLIGCPETSVRNLQYPRRVQISCRKKFHEPRRTSLQILCASLWSKSYSDFFTDSLSLYRQSFHIAPPDGTGDIGGVDLLTAKLCSRKRRDFSIMPGERAPCTVNRTLGGPQSRSRGFGRE